MSTDPEPKKPQENKVTILGLGRSGGSIVHYLQEKEIDCNLLYADYDEQALSESTVKIIRIEGSLEQTFEPLIYELKDSKKLIIVSGLGGNLCTLAVPIIVYIAEELELDFELLLSYPAGFEGRETKANADLIIDLLKEFNIEATIFEFDKLIGMLKQKTSMEDMFKIMNESVYQQIRRTLNDTQEY